MRKGGEKAGWMASLGLALSIIATLLGCGFGCIGTCDSLFSWYEPTDLSKWIDATGMLLFAPVVLITEPPLNSILLGSTIAFLLGLPKSLARHHFALLIPLLLIGLVAVWGAYWFLHSHSDQEPRDFDSWQLQVLTDLNLAIVSSAALIFIWCLSSSRWRGARLSALGALALQLTYTAMLNIWVFTTVSNRLL